MGGIQLEEHFGSSTNLTPAGWEVPQHQLIPTGSAAGLTSEGIYRKSGQNSKTTSLLEMLRRDARSVCLKEGEHQVDDVANTLKRFFRDLGDGLFTGRWGQDWLQATGESWGVAEGVVRLPSSAAALLVLSFGLRGGERDPCGSLAVGGERNTPMLTLFSPVL